MRSLLRKFFLIGLVLSLFRPLSIGQAAPSGIQRFLQRLAVGRFQRRGHVLFDDSAGTTMNGQ